ncbi:MAG: hypothetical protein WDZ44_00270 [Candidatus Spechtbacterales bacterium]
MGCGIACTASAAGLSYKQMKKHFVDASEKEHTTGFYNKDIVAAFKEVGMQAKGCSIQRWGDRKMEVGTIVFVERSKKYPEGHFLLKTSKGWMNPWINFPSITPAKAGFQKKLPGRVEWVIETSKI